MNHARFQEIASRYPRLKLAVIGDFCLDRYLEIDPARQETSIETGLPVHNVVRVRAQPGGAGTILNNLVALGIGAIYPVGFSGVDGEGFELRRALQNLPSVRMDYFIETDLRRTFTYCKPLVVESGKAPVELNRLDSKNWTPTPPPVLDQIVRAIESLAEVVDGMVLLDQVDLPETGVICHRVLETVRAVAEKHPRLLTIADSRRSLRNYPPVVFKMNATEFSALTGVKPDSSPDRLRQDLATFARKLGKPVFVTAAERGIFGATPDGSVEHLPTPPVRGPIDIVGAGDAVTANLVSAMTGGAGLREAMEFANAAASVVIHKLGTTGTASREELLPLLANP
jgi:rfaE bifunctional protein kinase chain/domain